MSKATSLKWVDDWYRAIATELIALDLPSIELHQRVQDTILNALYFEIEQRHGVSLPDISLKPSQNAPQIPNLTANQLGQIYEQILSHSPNEKKTGGAYYTPVQLVDFVIENTVKVWETQSPTILDPACGGGFFLLAAYEELLAQHPGQLSYSDRQQILLDCIYGVDISPQAIAVTKLSLLLKLVEGQSLQSLPDLSKNILCGNAIIGNDITADIPQLNPLSWELSFPHILKSGGFDIIIGNPPYVDSEWMTKHLSSWRQYCASHYKSATGNWDLFCIFIEKSLTLCCSDGLISLVVPNKLASADYAAGARSLLSTDSQIITVKDYSQSAAFEAAVYPLVFVAQKRSIPLTEQSGAAWAIAANAQQSQLLSRLQDQFPKLKAIAQVNGAATVAEAYEIQALIQEHVDRPIAPLRMVNSGTVDRYSFLWGKKPMRYLGKSYWHPVILESDRLPPKRFHQSQQPKIIVSGMTQRLECALDIDGSFLAGKSTSIILSSQIDDLYYLLGVLNSSLINFYFTSYFGGNCLQGKYLRVGAPQLRQIPIALSQDSQPLIQRVKQRLIEMDESEGRAIDRQIDQLVYALYELTTSEIQIIEQFL